MKRKYNRGIGLFVLVCFVFLFSTLFQVKTASAEEGTGQAEEPKQGTPDETEHGGDEPAPIAVIKTYNALKVGRSISDSLAAGQKAKIQVKCGKSNDVALILSSSPDDFTVTIEGTENGFVQTEAGVYRCELTDVTFRKFTIIISAKRDLDFTLSAEALGSNDQPDDPDPQTLSLEGTRLVLDGVLRLQFLLMVPSDMSTSDAGMTFSVNGRKQTVSLAGTEIEDGCHVFNCLVYAYEMADPITAEFSCGEETVTFTDGNNAYSVQKYLNTILASDYSYREKNIASATLRYGHFIQLYLASLHGWAVGTEHVAVTIPVDDNISQEAAVNGVSEMGFKNLEYDDQIVSGAKYSLNINACVDLNILVTLKESVSGERVTAKVNGTNAEAVNVGGNTWRLRERSIAANCLGTEAEFVLYVDDTEVFRITASPMSYVKTMLASSTNGKEKDALTALYLYYKAAVAE